MAAAQTDPDAADAEAARRIDALIAVPIAQAHRLRHLHAGDPGPAGGRPGFEARTGIAPRAAPTTRKTLSLGDTEGSDRAPRLSTPGLPAERAMARDGEPSPAAPQDGAA